MLSLLYVLITVLLSGLYVLLIIYILHHWSATPDYSIPPSETIPLHLSIIMPARNEENTIGTCISSILKNIDSSPHKVELIIVNDHSDDKTVDIIEAFQDDRIKLLHLENFLNGNSVNAYKKLALGYALREADGKYILQVDADVILADDYLNTLTVAIQNTSADFIAAPVIFIPDDNAFGHFQSLDMMGMMAITAAGIHSKSWYMANGANMIYKKSLATYQESDIASGDDIYTIQNIASKTNSKVLFLKDKKAVVSTAVEPTLKSFARQRLRWGTKNKQMSNPKMQLMMAIPFVNVLWLPVHLIFIFISAPLAISVGLFHVLMKLGIDYIYLKELTTFFDRQASMKWFLSSSMMHIIYLLVIGCASLVVKEYNWKGRLVS